MIEITKHKSPMNEQSKIALRYSWIVMVASLSSTFGGFMSLRQSQNWQNFLSFSSGLFLLTMAVTANLVSRKNRFNLAGFFLMLGGLTISVTSSLVLSGIGILTGIVSVVMTLLITYQILDKKYQLISMASGILVGIFCFLMEIAIQPAWRLTAIPPFVLAVLIGVMVVGLAYFLFRQFGKFSLRLKLIVAFLAISLTAVITVAALSTYVTRQALVKSVGQQLKNNSIAFGHSVGDFLNQYIVSLRILALNEKIETASFYACASYPEDLAVVDATLQDLDQQWRAAVAADDNQNLLVLDRLNSLVSKELLAFQEEFPDQVEVFTTDCMGGLVGSTNRTSDYLQADEGWWQAAYKNGEGAIYISTPEYDESSKTVSLLIALPIRDSENGEIIGILRSTVRLDSLIKLAASLAQEKGETDILFIGSPTLSLHEGLLHEISENEASQLNEIDKVVFKESIYGEIDSLVSVAPVRSTADLPAINDLKWLVVNHQDTVSALEPVQTQTNLIALLAFVIIVVIGFFASVIGQRLTSPISRLTEIASRVSAGELNTRADIRTGDEIEKLASTFNQMTDQLQGTLSGLEQRIKERTRALEASVAVGRRLTTILDQKQLVIEVVNQLQEAFHYYHVHIYLFDEKKEHLVMAGGTGEVGQLLLAHGHNLARGTGLVGQATETGTVVLVSDTQRDPKWLPNPLLPDTKSEISVPIMLGEEVLGAIDVQQNITGGLGQQDADLLQLVSSQVAVALRNARLYNEAQRQVERESRLNAILQHIQQTTTVDEALQVAIRDLGRVLKAPRTHIRLSFTGDSKGQE